MVKNILLSLLILLTAINNSFSQQQESSSQKGQNTPVSSEVMFEIVLADMISLPNEPFSVANAEFYLNTLENWIKNNPDKYNNLISGASKSGRYIVTRKQFENFSAEKQGEIKQWTKSIERLFTTQQKYLPQNNNRVFLLASYEYNYLKSLINK